MVKTLQKRYIFTAMLAVTVVLVIFLMTVNTLIYFTARRDDAKTLQLILSRNIPSGAEEMNGEAGPGQTESGGENPNMGERPEQGPDGNPMGGPPELPEGSRKLLDSEQYFFVRLSVEGDVVYTDFTHVVSMDEDKAAELIAEAEASGKTVGQVDNYRYVKQKDELTQGSVYVFLDTGLHSRNFLQTLLISLSVGGITWLLVFLLVVFLSGKAIRPIAENIERQKRFVTDAGHEIKTPLAIISANAEVLELHMGENKWTRNILAQTERLNTLTQNMLFLARMDEGRLEQDSGEKTELDAGAVMHEVWRPFREPAELKKIRCTEDLAEGVVIRVQREMLERLFSILFDNALKYTNEGGEIKMKLEKKGKGAEIRLTNSVEELPGTDPERLFDRFYRADESRSSKTGGSGIGLAAAVAIAEASGGSIHASYEDDHHICFTVRLG